MTARSIRRAAERKAKKDAEKQARVEQSSVETQSTVSEAKLTANHANAQLSTGPRTAAGKAVSSMNAVKTGLTGRTVLLPSEDAEAYRQHLAAYENEFKPVGLRECELVQSLADIQWRLQRIPGLEMAIYARGRDEFAEQFEEFDPAGPLSPHRSGNVPATTRNRYATCRSRKGGCSVSVKRTWPNSASYRKNAVKPSDQER